MLSEYRRLVEGGTRVMLSAISSGHCNIVAPVEDLKVLGRDVGLASEKALKARPKVIRVTSSRPRVWKKFKPDVEGRGQMFPAWRRRLSPPKSPPASPAPSTSSYPRGRRLDVTSCAVAATQPVQLDLVLSWLKAR